ncbi:hypothetical protein [Haloarchaeobius amylolyticus]|uniref:hypothetical protein n=1 Tax=Haloarchaeobius amylolyticus TaxID=1198296 RepID=UPI002270762A|nr:hypothetical protein [Haloarchaeobius amylolyticus]
MQDTTRYGLATLSGLAILGGPSLPGGGLWTNLDWLFSTGVVLVVFGVTGTLWRSVDWLPDRNFTRLLAVSSVSILAAAAGGHLLLSGEPWLKASFGLVGLGVPLLIASDSTREAALILGGFYVLLPVMMVAKTLADGWSAPWAAAYVSAVVVSAVAWSFVAGPLFYVFRPTATKDGPGT